MDREEDGKLFGKQSQSDSVFRRKARLLQSYYRAEVLKEPCGKGPTAKGIFRGNMLLQGEQSGSNFLRPEIFAYAKHRVENKKRHETISAYRLFNNMLSSQPMCFNCFQPLMDNLRTQRSSVTQIFRDVFPLLNINDVIRIDIEFIPDDYKDLNNDKSALDVFVEYKTIDGKSGIIGIEAKYSDVLGRNRGKGTQLSPEVAELFTDAARMEFGTNGFDQMARNFILAETLRVCRRYNYSTSVVLAPKDEPHAGYEVGSFMSNLRPENRGKIMFLSLEDFVAAMRQNLKAERDKAWIDAFYDRYLNFDLVSTYWE